jgi:hypothetical protein
MLRVGVRVWANVHHAVSICKRIPDQSRHARVGLSSIDIPSPYLIIFHLRLNCAINEGCRSAANVNARSIGGHADRQSSVPSYFLPLHNCIAVPDFLQAGCLTEKGRYAGVATAAGRILGHARRRRE